MSAFQTLNTCLGSAKGLFTVCEILPGAEQKFVCLPSGAPFPACEPRLCTLSDPLYSFLFGETHYH